MPPAVEERGDIRDLRRARPRDPAHENRAGVERVSCGMRGDQRADSHLGNRGVVRHPGLAAVAVLARKVRVELTMLLGVDSGQPLHRSHPVVARHHEAHGEAVIRSQRLVVHGPRQDRVGRREAINREIELVGDLAVGLDRPDVGTGEHEVHGRCAGAGRHEQVSQSNAAEARDAHRAEVPWRAARDRRHQGAAVARALEENDPLDRRERPELGECPGPWSLERAAELEAPRIGRQIGDRKVAANVEAIGGCQAITERRQVRLGVARVLAQRAQHAQVSEARM